MEHNNEVAKNITETLIFVSVLLLFFYWFFKTPAKPKHINDDLYGSGLKYSVKSINSYKKGGNHLVTQGFRSNMFTKLKIFDEHFTLTAGGVFKKSEIAHLELKKIGLAYFLLIEFKENKNSLSISFGRKKNNAEDAITQLKKNKSLSQKRKNYGD